MASNIRAQVMGGDRKTLDNVRTVTDVKNALQLTGNYTASINGSPANDSDALEDNDYVTFSQSIKGGSLIQKIIRFFI